MSAVTIGLKNAALRVVAAPSAVFLAVLTAGLAASSTARHTGLFELKAGNGNRTSVVLACPRSRAAAAKSAAAASSFTACRKNAPQAAAAAAAAESGTMETATETPRVERHSESKAVGGAGISIPLPDFNAPELSRFTSPL
jgi:hypothetical protein